MTDKRFKEFNNLVDGVSEDLQDGNFWGAFSELFQALNLSTELAENVDIITLSSELDELHSIDELDSFYRGSFLNLASYVNTFNLSRFFK